jgi:perosamine synthetase
MSNKKKVSDFRYNSSESKIPWSAVGEPVTEKDVVDIIKFLIPPTKGRSKDYKAQLSKVERGLIKLKNVGQYAGKLSLGNHVQSLENKCAKFLRSKHSLFVASCTSGFEIAFKLAGLKPGDEVIAPAITFIATIAYPLSIGAKVILADVDPRTMNMDPADVARKITKKTKVIFPVHLGGYPVNMAPLMKLAKKNNIIVIEDCAHAFGSSYKGKMVGSIGHFGAFSFHEVKNVTALGEGGILCTNTAFGKQFNQARFLGLNMSRQIPNWLYDIDALKTENGYTAAGNHSATEIQALVLSKQMDRMKKIIGKRKKAAEYLTRRLSKIEGVITPLGDDKNVTTSYHLYQLQIEPDKVGGDIQVLKSKLNARGIAQIPHFAPLYKFSIMDQLGYDTKAIEATCPVAEESFQHRFTHLPLYDFTKEQLKIMADAIIDSVEEIKKSKLL